MKCRLFCAECRKAATMLRMPVAAPLSALPGGGRGLAHRLLFLGSGKIRQLSAPPRYSTKPQDWDGKCCPPEEINITTPNDGKCAFMYWYDAPAPRGRHMVKGTPCWQTPAATITAAWCRQQMSPRSWSCIMVSMMPHIMITMGPLFSAKGIISGMILRLFYS